MNKLRILLADDSEDFLAAADRHFVTQSWAEVIGRARNGAEAVAQTEALKPDLVLMDIVMPGINGIEAVRRIKRLPEAPPVIMLSLHDNAEYQLHAREAGAVDYVPKSQFPHLLPEIICRVFGPNPRRGTAMSCSPAIGAQTLTAVLEQTTDTVLVTDRDGIIKYVNHAFEQASGYRRDEVVGQRPNLVSSGEHPPEFFKTLWQTLLRGEPFHAMFVNRRKDGLLYHEQQTITPVKDTSGQIAHFISTGMDVNEETHKQARLRESEERFRQVTENIREVFWLTTPDKDQMLYVSPAYEAIWGRSSKSLYAEPRSWLDAIHPEDRERVLRAISSDQASGQYAAEYRILQPDGTERWILDRAFPIRDAQGVVYRIAGIAEDITKRKQAEESLLDSEARLRAIIEAAPECVKLMKTDGTLLQINAAGLAILEADSAEAVLGSCMYGLVAAEYRGQFQAFIEQVAHGKRGSMEFEIISLKGGRRWLESHAVRFHSPACNGSCLLVAVTRDITERKRTERDLLQLAHYDTLTGLPNRLLFADRLRQAMVNAERHERLVGVVMLDIDQFKKINDSLGHATGDTLLQQVGERLGSALRPSDTVARLGGDEFTLVLADMAHVDDVNLVLQKIRLAFETPFRVDGRELFITVSIGITLFPFDDQDVQTLLHNADIAMYRAKESGRNTWQFYAAEMTAKANENLAIETELRGAIERHELELHYQPQVSLASGRITGMEALLRWRSARLGDVAPDRFIPIAEESGLIVPIGDWVLHTACEQARRWHAAGFPELRIAVNLSARQCRERDFFEKVRRALAETGLPPEMLELEVTESLLLKKVDGSATTLGQLDTLGVRFAIDDFGTGYSSLSYLKRLPIDVLKIDRSFVRDIAADPDDAAIVRAIITLARSLDIQVVAEGVETREQLQFLSTNDCDFMQGYYFSKPQPAEVITQLLMDGTALLKPA